MNQDAKRPSILIYNLDPQLTTELERSLAGGSVSVLFELDTRRCADHLQEFSADLIFCASDAETFTSAKGAVSIAGRQASIVVVSRNPEVTEWLDAIEAGASDYCAAPFETKHIRWIVQSHAYRRHVAAA